MSMLVSSGRETPRGVRLVDPSEPGILRRRSGRGFAYRWPDGSPVPRDHPARRRIESLAIPPAWTDVWICRSEHGHIQATGRDAAGRKQYRYLDRWSDFRNEAKFETLLPFGRALPRMRRRVEEDLACPDLSKERVLAVVFRLLESTLIRVGNAEYARDNDTFGLTTLRMRHVEIRGSRIRFRFNGKGGARCEIGLRDAELAGHIREFEALPGQDLFEYIDDDGEVRAVRAEDVNAYLRSLAPVESSAKIFRTWGASSRYLRLLRDAGPQKTKTAARRRILEAEDAVATILGNTRAVARTYYLHPGVTAAFENEVLFRVSMRRRRRMARSEAGLVRLLSRAAARADT